MHIFLQFFHRTVDDQLLGKLHCLYDFFRIAAAADQLVHMGITVHDNGNLIFHTLFELGLHILLPVLPAAAGVQGIVVQL